MTEQQEQPPQVSGRQYLRVEKFQYTPEYEGKEHYVLSPPAVALPHGIGYTGEERCESPPNLDGWVKEEGVAMLPKTGTIARKNDIYCEHHFTGFVPILIYVIAITAVALLACLLTKYNDYIVILTVILPLVILFLVCIFFITRGLAPKIIYNRVRREIYIYRSYFIRVQKFDTTRFLLSSATLGIDTESIHPGLKVRGFIFIGSSRGRNYIVPTWEYIRLYMDRGDAYKNLPTPEEMCFSRDPISRFFHKIETTYLSPPHRWPPEIEALLLPENKDAPLPDGWEYDTWVPCKMPWRGFDNTKQQKGR